MVEIESPNGTQIHLEERLAFEERLARLSATLINLPSDQLDQEIESGLETIVTTLGTDRAGLAQLSVADGELNITHSWSAPGIPPSPKGNVKDVFPWIFKEVQKGNKIVVSRVEDLPRRLGPAPSTMESTFDDNKPHVLTELGKEFVHYTLNEVVKRIGDEAKPDDSSHSNPRV